MLIIGIIASLFKMPIAFSKHGLLREKIFYLMMFNMELIAICLILYSITKRYHNIFYLIILLIITSILVNYYCIGKIIFNK